MDLSPSLVLVLLISSPIFNVSEPQFSYLDNGDKDVPYHEALLRGSDNIYISWKGFVSCKVNAQI